MSATSPPSTPQDHVLDNVVWHALNGPLARFARTLPGERGGAPAALRFDPEVGVFGAVERVGPAGWAALARLVGPGGQCALVRERVPAPPPGWEETFRGSVLQLVAGALPARPSFAWQVLGPEDGPDMLALAQLTEPGPYMPRTRELGRYVGVRRNGRLVAMAGERFRVPGFTEVSGVCTHPDVRGEGLGGALTLEVAHHVREQGSEAFLHVMADNTVALGLYEKLGFEVRMRGEVMAACWRDDGLPADAPRDPGD